MTVNQEKSDPIVQLAEIITAKIETSKQEQMAILALIEARAKEIIEYIEQIEPSDEGIDKSGLIKSIESIEGIKKEVESGFAEWERRALLATKVEAEKMESDVKIFRRQMFLKWAEMWGHRDSLLERVKPLRSASLERKIALFGHERILQ